jgi:hypothetical protein
MAASNGMAVCGTQGGEFNPFAGIHVHRHVPASGEGQADEPEVALSEPEQAPVLERGLGGIKGFTYFFSPLPAAAVVERLQSACGQLCGTVKVKGPFRLRSVVPLESAKVELDVAVWTLPADAGTGPGPVPAPEGAGAEEQEQEQQSLKKKQGDLVVVEVQRKQGDQIVFHKVFKSLKAKVLTGELEATGPEGVKLLEADDASEPPLPEMEETLSDDPGMI